MIRLNHMQDTSNCAFGATTINKTVGGKYKLEKNEKNPPQGKSVMALFDIF